MPQGILTLLAGLDSPAYVLDTKYDMLAWNEMFTALYGDMDAHPSNGRNVIRWMFSMPDMREHLCDAETSAFVRGSVADLRAAIARYPDDKGIRDLVTEMLALSKEFAEIWAEHEVEVRRDTLKRFHHPIVGRLDMLCQVLHIPDRDQRLVLYTAAPGSSTQESLCRLRMLSPATASRKHA